MSGGQEEKKSGADKNLNEGLDRRLDKGLSKRLSENLNTDTNESLSEGWKDDLNTGANESLSADWKGDLNAEANESLSADWKDNAALDGNDPVPEDGEQVQQLELNIEVPEESHSATKAEELAAAAERPAGAEGGSRNLRFINAKIVTPDGVIDGGTCVVADGRIVSVEDAEGQAVSVVGNGQGGSAAKGKDEQVVEAAGHRAAESDLHRTQGSKTDGSEQIVDAAGHRAAKSDPHRTQGSRTDSCEQIVDAAGGWLLPGFVDIHVHGGMGEDFMDAGKPGVLETIAKFHGSHGSTSMLATTMTATHDMIDGVLEAVWAYRHRQQSGMPGRDIGANGGRGTDSGSGVDDRMHSGTSPGASIEGVHLEGPFISPKWPGAQNPDHISQPRTDWLEDWEARFPGLIRQLTLAPEREGALETIAWLRANGRTAALGHTDASYEEVQAAVGAGLNHAVHTFNAMTPLHHRGPGAAGAVLGSDEITAEIIADGIHVHPGAVKLLAKVKTDGNLVLVTDAMSAAGLGDGDYFLGDLPVKVEGGVALTQGGALAGSRLTMIEGFRFLVRQADLSVERASHAASAAPARQAGIYEKTGSIEQGKRADLVLLDEELDLRGVWAAGQKIG